MPAKTKKQQAAAAFLNPSFEDNSDMLNSGDAGGDLPVDQNMTVEGLNTPLSRDFSNPIQNGGSDIVQFGDLEDDDKGSTIGKLGNSAKSSFDSIQSRALRKGTAKSAFNNGMLMSKDIHSGKVFREDPASYSLFSTITSPRVQDKVKALLRGMHEHAEGQQHTMTDQMDYQDILGKGILYQGEYLVDGLEPMRLQTLEIVKAEDAGFSSSASQSDAQKETRFGIRLYLTNQRLIVVDAEPDRGSRMSEEPKTGILNRKNYKLSYEIESELWYYPIPLADVKGLALDVRTITKSAVTLKIMRPWWAILFAICGGALVVYGILRVTGVVSPKDWGVAAIVTGSIISVVMAITLFTYQSLVSGKFEPWQLQERQVRLGITDPISQQNAIFYCNMADSYTVLDATGFVHYMQENTPQLHYGSLTPAVMTSKVTSPYDRTFLTTNEEPEKIDREEVAARTKKKKKKQQEQPTAVPIDIKVVFEKPIGRIIKVRLDNEMSLDDCTEAITTQAMKAGVLPKSTAIRLAMTDVEGDVCLLENSADIQAEFARQEANGAVRVFAWPEFTSMPAYMA